MRLWPGTRIFARAVVAALTAAVPLFASHAFAAAQNPAIEYAVKAAYLSKFALFAEWPEAVFATPASAVTLCVAGLDPFGDALDKVAGGERIGERPIVIRRLQTVSRNSGCHILYVGGSDAQSVAQALDAVNGTSVLTVTDAARRAERPGIIDFIIVNGRVRFNVDEQAAALNGIAISSHLLSLAVSVKPRT